MVGDRPAFASASAVVADVADVAVVVGYYLDQLPWISTWMTCCFKVVANDGCPRR